jgi:hypothetical protein
MTAKPSDAIIFFGAAGDLAYKQTSSRSWTTQRRFTPIIREPGAPTRSPGTDQGGPTWRNPNIAAEPFT